MGLDLYLLPVNGDHRSVFYAHSLIPLDRNGIIGAVREVAEEHAADIPEPLSCFLAYQRNGEHGYGYAKEDPYGASLQFVLAKHLKPLAERVGILIEGIDDETLKPEPKKRPTAWDRVAKDSSLKPKRVRVRTTDPWESCRSPLNRAAFAYIAVLPDDFKIVLYWH